ncbi:MAG: hypothetical protein AAGI92_01220 [Pseudomonadota bacterium]
MSKTDRLFSNIVVVIAACLVWIVVSEFLLAIGLMIMDGGFARLEAWLALPRTTYLRVIGDWPFSGLMVMAAFVCAVCLLQIMDNKASRPLVFSFVILAVFLGLKSVLSPALFDAQPRAWIVILVGVFGGAWISFAVVESLFRRSNRLMR